MTIFRNSFLRQLLFSCVDLAPVMGVVLLFQLAVIRQPLPNALQLLLGTAAIVIGLTLFIQGLEQALFPLGESMAFAFARKGSMPWLLTFAFALGFATTVAEPALIAVADKAAEVAAQGGVIAVDPAARKDYAFWLRLTVALGVGVAIMIGVIRIIKGWPLHYLMVLGYLGVVVMTVYAPPEIIGVAYDSGGVTTSTITVPLVTALGVGLATAIKGRNPVVDGFGLIALASLTPIIFVMAFGILVKWS